MGNSESTPDKNIQSNIKTNTKQVNSKPILRKSTHTVPVQKSLMKQPNNLSNIEENLDNKYHKNKDIYTTPVYEHKGSRICDGFNNYQYFKPEIPITQVDGQFGIDSQKDNKYSESINNLYESNIKSRDKSLNYRTSLINPSPYVNNTEQVENQNNEYTDIQNTIKNEDINNNSTNSVQNNDITILREDALEIRDAAYLTNLEKRIMIMNNILLEDIDPLNIKDTEGLYLQDLKTKYISLRNIYHPDKRGTSNYDLFIRITDAINHHNLILKSCIMDKDFIQLRNGYNRYQHT